MINTIMRLFGYTKIDPLKEQIYEAGFESLIRNKTLHVDLGFYTLTIYIHEKYTS